MQVRQARCLALFYYIDCSVAIDMCHLYAYTVCSQDPLNVQLASHQGGSGEGSHAPAISSSTPLFPATDGAHTSPSDQGRLPPLTGILTGLPTGGGASPIKTGRARPQQTGPPLSSPSPLPARSNYHYPGVSPASSPSHAYISRLSPPPPSPSPTPPADPHLDPGTLQGLMHMCMEPKLPARRFHAEEITQVWADVWGLG